MYNEAVAAVPVRTYGSVKALDYAKPHEDPEVERKLVLYRLFRLPLPPV
jgi:hypothetical protein